MKTILCPVDFSEHSILAAEWATMIAVKCNWKLVLLNRFLIYADDQILKEASADVDVFDKVRTKTEVNLLHLKDRLCEKYKSQNLQCSVMTQYGIETDKVILQNAEGFSADLIVMGTGGADKLKDTIFGSNTTHIVNKSKIPVLIVPSTAADKLPDTFIYASDIKNEDEHIISFVLDLARELNSKVIFLHVSGEGEQSRMSELKSMVSAFIGKSSFDNDRNKILFDEIKSDNLFAALEGYAGNKKAGLIVLGKHQKNLFEKIIKGDLTRLMSLYSFIPLLIIQKKD